MGAGCGADLELKLGTDLESCVPFWAGVLLWLGGFSGCEGTQLGIW